VAQLRSAAFALSLGTWATGGEVRGRRSHIAESWRRRTASLSVERFPHRPWPMDETPGKPVESQDTKAYRSDIRKHFMSGLIFGVSERQSPNTRLQRTGLRLPLSRKPLAGAKKQHA
jgi:hypothetical protein